MRPLRDTGRRAARNPRPDRTDPDLTAALHSITEFGQWIRNADTKAAALAAVQALGLTVVLGRAADLRLWSTPAPSGRIALAAGLSVCLALLLASIALVTVEQLPRMATGTAPSRHAFPTVARLSAVDLATPLHPKARRGQAWAQATDLAAIGMQKYRWLRRAMATTLIALAAVVCWLVAAAFVMPR